LRVTWRVVVPLAVSLAWALACLVGLPLLLGGSLSVLLLTIPDLGWVLTLSGVVALAWGVGRAILAVRTLHRRAQPNVPAQAETVSA
jgi:hypothetical protein